LTHTWIGALGIVLFLVSVLFAVVALGDLRTGGSPGTDPAGSLGVAVFFLLLAACGAWMAADNIWRPRRAATMALEERILALAEARQGLLTVDEVAMACHLSVARSKAALDRLAAAGGAEMRSTGRGVLVYAFAGFLSDDEKRSAKPL